MAPTTVTGVDRLMGLPYEVTLNADPTVPVLAPFDLVEQMPAKGEFVVDGPAGREVEFDPADPAAVMAWLHGATNVIAVSGPALASDDDDEEGDEDGPAVH